MATFTRKYTSVTARQRFGANLPVTSVLKGDQVCLNGDFLVIDQDAVNSLRAQEKAEGLDAGSLGDRGTVYVIAKADFLRDFNAPDESPAIVGETGFNVPNLIDVPKDAPVAVKV